MKTLDEVIDSLEKGEPSFGGALHYLKEYREKEDGYNNAFDEMEKVRKRYREAQQQYITAHANLYAEEPNEPLTWDELKQMEGKPVWVEDYIDEPEDLQGYWAVYRRIDKAQTTEYALLSDLLYDKAEYGKTWQVYRKERE